MMDTSFKCLGLIAQFHRFPVDEDQLAHQFSVEGQFFDVVAVLRANKVFTLKAKQVTVSSNKLLQPLLQVIVKAMFGNFSILAKIAASESSSVYKLLVHDVCEATA